MDPIATRDADCSAPSDSEGTESSSSETNSQQQQSSLLVATTGSALFVTLVLLSGFGGSAVTFAVMRKRFTTKMNHRSVDFGGAWSIDGNEEEDDYGLELTEERRN